CRFRIVVHRRADLRSRQRVATMTAETRRLGGELQVVMAGGTLEVHRGLPGFLFGIITDVAEMAGNGYSSKIGGFAHEGGCPSSARNGRSRSLPPPAPEGRPAPSGADGPQYQWRFNPPLNGKTWKHSSSLAKRLPCCEPRPFICWVESLYDFLGRDRTIGRVASRRALRVLRHAPSPSGRHLS